VILDLDLEALVWIQSDQSVGDGTTTFGLCAFFS